MKTNPKVNENLNLHVINFAFFIYLNLKTALDLNPQLDYSYFIAIKT